MGSGIEGRINLEIIGATPGFQETVTILWINKPENG
jgi:hypothetical protein